MTPERFQRFCTPAEWILILPSEGKPPRRLDGKPLTDDDRALVAGIDPLAEPGAPPIPAWIPDGRLEFVTIRTIDAAPGTEAEAFVYLTDTNEWVAETDEEAALIRAAHPEARIAREP